ncbi:MAG: hypothetical protein HYV09_02835 [Deltaproteobacteria bacterium]|nr:hypothetical protein [Deltaproteobacteria bacterium]
MLRRFFRFTSLSSVIAIAACSSSDEQQQQPTPDAGPTDLCQTPEDQVKTVRFAPHSISVAPGESREVRVFIEPDVCVPTPVPLEVANAGTAKVDGTFIANLQSAEAMVKIVGVAAGKTTVLAKFGPSSAILEVDVRPKELPACGAVAKGNLAPGGSVKAAWNASLSVAPGATRDTTSIDPLDEASTVAPFDAEIGCAADAKGPDGYEALGPAVSFAPTEKKFLRELAFEIPVNPAAMPQTANLRHVRVQFTSKSLSPRFVPVTNPRFEPRGSGWVLRFDAPRLGTYQAFVAKNAGTVKKKRKLTHRAVFGFSMGGIGSSMFGMNHHDQFDLVVPLGGPMDAAHFLNYSLEYHFGGFCERKAGDPVPTTPCKASVGKPREMYQHVQWFEDWWHQRGVDGTGGTFGRDQMVNIFRDVSSAWGDPAFANPTNPHVAMGITDPKPLNEDAADYCGDPAKATVAEKGFYDRKYNPDGSLPVIKFCDGARQPEGPGKWAPGGKRPLEMVLAVDYNKNGQRDEGEPVIVQPFEPFSDFGKDGKASKDEAGYDAVDNPDPAGDDYDPQYNPLGTEKNGLWEAGEPFEDIGLDGVKCPTGETCKYDVGEGNGKFDLSAGLSTFFKRDGRMQIQGHPLSADPDGGKWTDDALDQLDFYSDGGIRDIFNWGTVGYHYMGAFGARNRPSVYFNEWVHLPNVEVKKENCSLSNLNDCFDPKEVDWSALPKSVYLRYGDIDANNRWIEKGDGQHVGYADQVFRRVQTGLFYIGSRWPDADRRYFEDPPTQDGLPPCVGESSCTYEYKDSTGRAGPVTVLLPPGYRSDAAKDLRYPVVYFLHGYGQSPEDLQAFVLLVSPMMGQGLSSRATRLQKMIMVFVDGRCREGSTEPECVRGTFYVDSVRDKGPKMDKYFQDLMKHIDEKYRTLGPTEIEVTE